MSPRFFPSRAVPRGLASLLGLLAPACLSWSELESGACGDGFVGREEACDDGNRISGDGCSDGCRSEPASCGDGRTTPGEDCDDANDLESDGCLNDCRDARCGDGQLRELTEACDDGNEIDGDGCSAECRLEALPSGPYCGDGNLDEDEACDDGNDSKTDSCLVGCSFAVCGDGVVRRGVEECDGAGSDKACSRGCLLCGDAPGSYFRAGNGHCYTLHSDALTQPKARAACQAEGGDLWTVTSETEDHDVPSKLALDSHYWLGLLTSELTRNWVSGEGTKYTHFGAGEPRDVTLRCVSFQQGVWGSEACGTRLPYVCERGTPFVSPLDHHAYGLHTEPLSVSAAQARCEASGGQLAALETDSERLFVGKNVAISVWLSGTDSVEEGRFAWPDGRAVDANVFAAGRPNDPDGTRDCLLFNPGDKFADASCDEPRAFLCEFD